MAKYEIRPQLLFSEEERIWRLGLDLESYMLSFYMKMMLLIHHQLTTQGIGIIPVTIYSLCASPPVPTGALAKWQAKAGGSDWVCQPPREP